MSCWSSSHLDRRTLWLLLHWTITLEEIWGIEKEFVRSWKWCDEICVCCGSIHTVSIDSFKHISCNVQFHHSEFVCLFSCFPSKSRSTHMYLTTIQQESFKNSDPHYIDEFIVLKLGMMIGMWGGRESVWNVLCLCWNGECWLCMCLLLWNRDSLCSYDACSQTTTCSSCRLMTSQGQTNARKSNGKVHWWNISCW